MQATGTARPSAVVSRTENPDRDRLASSYREYGPRLARCILAITGDPTTVDDLLNEAFIRAYEGIAGFESRSSLSTWLHGIVINVARAHVAKARRRRRLDVALAPADAEAGDLETQVRRRDAIRRLYAVLDLLDEDLRLAFVLVALEGRSLKEASKLLGVPVSTLHARRQRAEAFVQAQLEEDEG